jgi:outer membrane protein OmpA-like peptidoglycan-associated protein
MKRKFQILQIIIILVPANLISQSHYEVELSVFSSPKYDEFCPMVYNDHIVFCSNQEHELLITYQNKKKKGLFNIFKVNIDPEVDQQNPKIFSQNLVTPFNDGPVSFSPDGKQVVYSRNMDVHAKAKNMYDLSNNLGVYFAELKDGEWKPIGGFPFNNLDYSITTPCFSPNGQYLYFGSDMPGGFGGADLYRSEQIDGVWGEPVNLGENVNSAGNEVYPYLTAKGDLFFASNGHGGLGKKDIFLTRMSGSGWILPVHLEAPINSVEDDFGFVTDDEFSEGFFSSSRAETDDIYRFHTLIPQLFDCDTMLENNYCFEFWDEQYPDIDSIPVVYEWEFSDGTKKKGLRVEHCLPGAGKHWAKLNIIDNTTNDLFITQSTIEFELEDHIQPYIISKETEIINETMEFSGLNSNLPGYSIEEYVWDFGDGAFETGPEVEHQFITTGVHAIKLGLTGYADGSHEKETRCVVKSITLVQDNQDLAMHLAGIIPFVNEDMENSEGNLRDISLDLSVFDMNPEEEVFRVEVIASEDKIMLEDALFEPLREQYEIKEFYLSSDSLFSYTVGEYHSLLPSYAVYYDVVDKGFSTATVKTYVLAELPTEFIAKINREFAQFADANFEFNQYEVSEKSYPMLDLVLKVMEENPDLLIEVAAHTDNLGTIDFNLELSQKRAQSIVDYLVSKGINEIRLKGNGYGEARPISTNSTEEGRRMNRRVEFLILNY